MVHVSNTGEAFRRRLADPDCVMDYPVLHDLRDEGVTDYVVAPLHFSGGEVHFSSWATRQPGGFTDAEIEAIQSLIAPLARVAEIRAWYRVAGNLLTTYVGKNAGERVLAGHIRRGDTEAIHAAIWLSDMRGFTMLADTLPPQDLVDLLNRYFDCQVPAIIEHGGEVLKYMGDGLLAIFPSRRPIGRRRRAESRQSGAQSDCCARCERRQWQRPALWFGAACRRRAVRQYRQRQPAGFHLHRPGGKLGGAA